MTPLPLKSIISSSPLHTTHSHFTISCVYAISLSSQHRASCCSQRLPLTLATTKPCQFTLTIASPSVTVSSSHSGLNTAHVIILYVQNALLLSFKLDCQICSFFPFTIISNVTSLKRQSLHSLRKPPAEYTPQVESKDRFPWVLQHTPMTIPAPNPTGYHFWIL